MDELKYREGEVDSKEGVYADRMASKEEKIG